jgi:hypothetical protein
LGEKEARSEEESVNKCKNKTGKCRRASRREKEKKGERGEQGV